MSMRARKRLHFRRLAILAREWRPFGDDWFIIHQGVYIYRWEQQWMGGKK